VAVQCPHDTDAREHRRHAVSRHQGQRFHTACIPRPHARTGETQRILPYAVTVKFTTRADGEWEPFTEGNSKPVSVVVTNAGIATVEQYDLRMG
jgi:hypothetical protein